MQVIFEDTFDSVIRLKNLNKNPVALDFASGTNPGGSWRSKQTGTQEESLCRRSNLGILLEGKKYPIPREGAIYLNNVLINKNLNMETLSKPIKCSIIASELKGISSSSEEYLKSRITSLYNIAISNGHDVLILGAWGCGAFKESDEDVQILANIIKICANKFSDKIDTVCAVIGRKNYNKFLNV